MENIFMNQESLEKYTELERAIGNTPLRQLGWDVHNNKIWLN